MQQNNHCTESDREKTLHVALMLLKSTQLEKFVGPRWSTDNDNTRVSSDYLSDEDLHNLIHRTWPR